jgi:hypothetical protein
MTDQQTPLIPDELAFRPRVIELGMSDQLRPDSKALLEVYIAMADKTARLVNFYDKSDVADAVYADLKRVVRDGKHALFINTASHQMMINTAHIISASLTYIKTEPLAIEAVKVEDKDV